ncbi:hypothetical protein MLD38_003321 [Melastoma candidum]|uniref:Uncharacterized protein n=1 Tax=Melastoma candidum TaxID=119954 RepID=A0ACB9S1P9_9MYRT|nr:hypothetical protein MLD38_003321 [Melastoma candidum]
MFLFWHGSTYRTQWFPRNACSQRDLLLSYGYEDDLRALTTHIPKRCQCLLMSATSSADVDKLKRLILHNPYILTLPEVADVKDDVIPKNVQQFWVSCPGRDKLLYVLVLLKLELVQKKVLIFTNSIDTSYRLRLFIEKDVAKSVTRIAVRESRAQDLRNEILNSEKLKEGNPGFHRLYVLGLFTTSQLRILRHFEANPRDLDLLKHDTVLSKKAPAPHLRNVPDYLIDQKTKEARNMVKLTQAAMGNINTNHKQGFKRKSRKSRDPLKTFKGEAQRKRNQEGALCNKDKKRRSHE